MSDRLYKLMPKPIALLAGITNDWIAKFRDLAELDNEPADTLAMASP
ncbi:hypothetical protein BH10PSE6_BH10PSE6_35830 [soil metagenome]